MKQMCAFLLVVALAGGATAEEAGVKVVRSFLDRLEEGTLFNPGVAEIRRHTLCGGQAMDGLYLHPGNAAEATTLTFADIALPSLEGGNTDESGAPALAFVFQIGLQDGIQWNDPLHTPNGVQFSVAIEGERVFEQSLAESIWRPALIDLGPWAGKTVSIAFGTSSIDGNLSYDWAIFGDPCIVQLKTAPEPVDLGWAAASPGLTLVKMNCTAAGRVQATVDGGSWPLDLREGIHWYALPHAKAAPPTLEIASAQATHEATRYAPFVPDLRLESVELSQRVLVKDRPFTLLAHVKNFGRGAASIEQALVPSGDAKNEAPRAEEGVIVIPPGAEWTYRWPDQIASADGPWRAAVALGDVVKEVVATPRTPDMPDAMRLTGHLDLTVGEELARLRIHLGPNEAPTYCLLQVRSGKDWNTVGTISPLAEIDYLAATPGGGQERKTGGFQLSKYSREGNNRVLRGKVGGLTIGMKFSPEADGRRIHVRTELAADTDIRLRRLRVLGVAAGDHSGSARGTAIFPGLEFLEAHEASSSTRDLAPPLNERWLPALYKPAAPLMAVDIGGTLVGMLWNPSQNWAPGEAFPAAYFDAPEPEKGRDFAYFDLQIPSVGKYQKENSEDGHKAFAMKPGDTVSLESWLLIDPPDAAATIPGGEGRAGAVLKAFRHFFDVRGVPQPSPQPRNWAAEKELCADAFMNAVWSDEPVGFRHCAGWDAGLLTGLAVPARVLQQDGVSDDVREALGTRIERVLERALEEKGPTSFASNAGAHIVNGLLPFYEGYLPENLAAMREQAFAMLERRDAEGRWTWQPRDARHAALGAPGGHTLGQAASALKTILRAARLTGHQELRRQALLALEVMKQYQVPRGAQMWECPLYQPDILAAAQAISAYCDAYRITGDPKYIEEAVYWAWTGLPFLYLWEMDRYPTMKYNVISVIGSTWFTHSWIGLPVVWCGLVYAYALQDLAEFDDSLPWLTFAQGITNSAMHQQYTEGPSKGCYPDSWNMEKNIPLPADINPENIILNESRLRGNNPDIRTRRIPATAGEAVINSLADIPALIGSVADGTLGVSLAAPGTRSGVYTVIAPVREPKTVAGSGERAADSAALRRAESGWQYDREGQCLVLKTTLHDGAAELRMTW